MTTQIDRQSFAGVRRYRGLNFSASAPSFDVEPWLSTSPATFTLRCMPSGEPLRRGNVQPGGGGFYWEVGVPEHEIIVPDGGYLVVEWEGRYGIGEAELLFRAEDGKSYVERHTFPSLAPAAIIPL